MRDYVACANCARKVRIRGSYWSQAAAVFLFALPFVVLIFLLFRLVGNWWLTPLFAVGVVAANLFVARLCGVEVVE
ncbi:hypothetical protein [Albidovulum sp.]|uniref:hypothetical protein n=1 Tax=Albidovulum sp. TaxID=1872424 RepID=UPI0039B960B8